jgi:O-Antigen ligase
VQTWGRQRAVPTSWLDAAATFTLAAGAVALLGFASGGYYETTRSVGTVLALAVGASALVRTRRLNLATRDVLLLSALAALAALTGLEAGRRGAATRGVPELELCMLYAASAWVALVALRRSNAVPALAGILTGIVAVLAAGLVTLLLPGTVRADPLEGRLLFEPVGYANACGILAVVGLLLAVGLAAHASSTPLTTAAAAAVVPLAVELDLTGSRGAAAAAGVGLAVALALDPARRRLAPVVVAVLPLPLLGVWIAHVSRVTDADLTPSIALRNGRILVAVVVALTLAQAALALRLRGARLAGKPALYVLVALLLLGSAAVSMRIGGALGDRPAYWRVAAADAVDHPLLGSGPGSFASEWLRRRTAPVATRNAHSLYVETLAELGPLGLGLLLAALAVPIAAAVRKRTPVTAVAASAYAAFLAHAAIDWDWQMPVVVVAALGCGGVVLAVRRETVARGGCRVGAALALSAVLVAGAGLMWSGERALARAGSAAAAGDWAAAAHLSRVAAARQPWSAAPSRVLGEAELALGERRRAHAAFARAAALDPGDWRTWAELARLTSGREREAAIAHVMQLDAFAVRRVGP